MKKPLIFLLSLTFLFLFCATVSGDYKTVEQRKISAEQGEAVAQFILGAMYERGEGVPQDYKKAVKWYRLSAEQGNTSAQYGMGVMYQYGMGVPQDDQEAVKWFRLAAEQGKAGAQLILGMMYGNGQGVPQDYVSAHMWINLAASNGYHPYARKIRNRVEKQMSPSQIEKAQEMARDWKPSNK